MKKEYDLKKLKKREKSVVVDKDAAKIQISLRLDGSVLAALKSDAEKLGIPYQTHISSILYQYVNKNLISKTAIEMAKMFDVS